MTRLSPGLIAAYRGTLYRVHSTPTLDKRIGHRCLATERLMHRHRVRTAAVLTAENPGSRRQPDLVNRIRARRLDAALKHLGFKWLPTSAIDLNGLWPSEVGRFILGPSLADIARLARRFDQNAFIWVMIGRPTGLILRR